jgi:hypothetical protein
MRPARSQRCHTTARRDMLARRRTPRLHRWSGSPPARTSCHRDRVAKRPWAATRRGAPGVGGTPTVSHRTPRWRRAPRGPLRAGATSVVGSGDATFPSTIIPLSRLGRNRLNRRPPRFGVSSCPAVASRIRDPGRSDRPVRRPPALPNGAPCPVRRAGDSHDGALRSRPFARYIYTRRCRLPTPIVKSFAITRGALSCRRRDPDRTRERAAGSPLAPTGVGPARTEGAW